MSSEESGTDGDRRSFADATDHPQHLEFILGRKTVAALDLDAARTHCDDLADTFHRLLVKLVLGSFVQAVGGIQDAAAPLGDLFVAQAVDLVQELLFAASGINQMGMRIAERREKHASLRIDDFRVGSHLRHLVHRAVCSDTIAVGQQPGVVDLAEYIHVAPLDPKTAALVHADDLGYVLNE